MVYFSVEIAFALLTLSLNPGEVNWNDCLPTCWDLFTLTTETISYFERESYDGNSKYSSILNVILHQQDISTLVKVGTVEQV